MIFPNLDNNFKKFISSFLKNISQITCLNRMTAVERLNAGSCKTVNFANLES